MIGSDPTFCAARLSAATTFSLISGRRSCMSRNKFPLFTPVRSDSGGGFSCCNHVLLLHTSNLCTQKSISWTRTCLTQTGVSPSLYFFGVDADHADAESPMLNHAKHGQTSTATTSTTTTPCPLTRRRRRVARADTSTSTTSTST